MNSINETYSLNSLSKDELKTILESLLFSSSVDVCAEFYKQESLDMLELAKKIRTMFPEIVLDTIYVHVPKTEKNNELFNDEHTKELIEYFPELVNQEVIV
jgi:ribonucleotide reductase beta subunit family protein with ferritin-like domain